MSASPTASPPARHILIDFENVPTANLAAISGMPVEVTLLVGERNKRLEIGLVTQLLAGGSRVHLVQVGASGRNALDLTLAYYLGRAASENPRAEFFIISRDTDYDPMIAHVNRHGGCVSRHAAVEALPFLPPAKPPPARRTDDRYEQVAAHLLSHPHNRPKRRTTLLSHIRTHFGNKVAEADAAAIIARLQDDGHIVISEKGVVGYPG